MCKYLGMAATLLAAQLLYSCSEYESSLAGSAPGQIVTQMEQPRATRTAVGGEVAESNAVGIVWTDGDEIGVFDQSGTSQRRYAKVGQGTAPQATFSASGAEPFENPVYAYYPFSEDNAHNGMATLSGTLPAEQEMDSGTLHGDYKIGQATSTTDGGAYVFTFKHLFSMARITVDAADTPLQGESLKSITVSVTRGEAGVSIAGNFTFSAENGSWTLTGEGNNSITLSWNAQPPTLDQARTCYMNLLPLVKRGDLITVKVTTDKHVAEFSANSLTDFAQETIYNFPVSLNKYSDLKVYDEEGKPVQGSFTCAALNVDGLPSLINGDGPGSDGTKTLGSIMNGLGYDFIAVSEDFSYHDELAKALSLYNAGTYRGSATNFLGRNDTDGLGFFWKKDGASASGETFVQFTAEYGGLQDGAITLVKKGFRHYVVTVADGVEIDVYITHMNTYGGSGNTDANAWVKAQIAQLCQLRDYAVERARTNKRPAIIMGDTNMRYTRHQIVGNLITPVTDGGLQIADPWVEFHRGGKYPEWNTNSLMISSKFAGDANDILCSDDQRGEVVDKIWYINVPDAPLQIKATSCANEVDHFTKSEEQASYSGVTVEEADGNVLTNQSVNYTKRIGYADHFPVVASFRYTLTK